MVPPDIALTEALGDKLGGGCPRAVSLIVASNCVIKYLVSPKVLFGNLEALKCVMEKEVKVEKAEADTALVMAGAMLNMTASLFPVSSDVDAAECPVQVKHAENEAGFRAATERVTDFETFVTEHIKPWVRMIDRTRRLYERSET